MTVRLKHIFALFMLVSASVAGAADFRVLPAYLDGSMMPYDFATCDSLPVVPDSLQPVYIGYVARHGARFMSSPKKVENISKLLYNAAMQKKLTNVGEHFYDKIKEMDKATSGRWGMLSPVGIAEEQRLGADMAHMFPKLFKEGEVNAISTYVPRVVMTMYEFLHSFENIHRNVDMFTASGKDQNRFLRCFQTDSAYSAYRADGDWQGVYDEYLSKFVSPEPARRLLAANYENDKGKLRKITMDMYNILSACRAAGIEPPTTEFMTQQEYRGCWLAANLEHYLRNSVSPISTACASATAPLIERIIADADSAISTGRGVNGRKFNGYFGHAETLMPLFSTMGIKGCFSLPLDYDDLYKTWQVQQVTPLGANLMIILMKNNKGKVYASLRLNGRNISPMPDSPMIVSWNELKEFWLARVGMLSVSTGNDLP